MADETHRIRQNGIPNVADIDTPERRVEGSEQLIGRIHPGLGHQIK